MAILIGLSLSFTLLLSNKSIQKFAVNKVSTWLTQEIGYEVSIASVAYSPFSEVQLNGIILRDSTQTAILSLNSVYADIHIIPLFHKKVIIENGTIDGLDFNLTIDQEHHSNLQKLLDYFKTLPKSEEKTSIELRSIRLRDCNFSFDKSATPILQDKDRMDFNHLDFKAINAYIKLNYTNKNSINIKVKEFNLKEKSGFTIKDLAFQAKIGKHQTKINQFELILPQSNISFNQLQLKYDSLSAINSYNWIVSMPDSYISGNDICCFVPKLKRLRAPLKLKLKSTGELEHIKLDYFSLNYGKYTNTELSGELIGITKLSETFIYADIKNIEVKKNDIESFITDISKKPYTLPKELSSVGAIKYKGKVSGFFSNLVADGKLSTNVGDLRTDIMINYNHEKNELYFNGALKTKQIDLRKILGDKVKLKDIAFDLKVNGHTDYKNSITGKAIGNIISLNYNGYSFNEIKINGEYKPNLIVGKLSFQDKNGNGSLTSEFDYHKNGQESFIKLNARIDSIRLNRMKLIKTHPDLALSIQTNTNIKYSNLDDIVGQVNIDSIIVSNDENYFFLDSLRINSESNANIEKVNIQSNLIKAEILGNYTLSSCINNLQYIISQHLPAINKIKTDKITAVNNFSWNMEIQKDPGLAEILNLPININDITHISGHFNDSEDILELDISSGLIATKKTSLKDFTFHLNTKDSLNLKIETILQTRLDTTKLAINSSVYNNNINLDFSWINTVESLNDGDLFMKFNLKEPKRKNQNIDLTCQILPSEITLSDSLWNIRKGTIKYDEEHLTIDNVAFESSSQFLKINGAATKGKNNQQIEINLKDINLAFLSEVIYMPNIKLAGIASGKVTVSNLLDIPILEADVKALDFGLNNYALGDADVKATYNREKEQIELDGIVTNKYLDVSKVTGFIAPSHNKMLLDIDLNHVELGFIQQYVSSFAYKLNGIATGKLYVGGKLNGIKVWADAIVDDGVIGIDFLQTEFYFADSVHMKKNEILIKDVEINDGNGHYGRLDLSLKHNSFRNMKFNIDVDVNNMLVFNASELKSPDLYGTVYATGEAKIFGDSKEININANAEPQENSLIAIPMDSYLDATDNKFITYIDKDKTVKRLERRKKRKQLRKTADSPDLNVNIQIEATPAAEVQLVMDNQTKETIKARGNGSIKVSMKGQEDLKLFGTYTATTGEYWFSLENAIRKKFEMAENSKIIFDGNPFKGQLDIKAVYQTMASLTDLLDESLIEGANSNVKTNCIANISGPLKEPIIKFDIELPNSDEEIQRRVRSTINSEDMMTQQIVLLLLAGKFYNPSLIQDFGSYSSELATSFATTTISNQLNYWLSKVSNNINLGLNYTQDNSEVDLNQTFEVSFSTNLFDNRLIIKSNLGYRYEHGIEDFIGDFDLEYKLNKSGRLRLKAYNETNDRLYSSSLYTQGAGIMYQEEFDSWSALFKYYKKVFSKKTATEIEEKQAIKDKNKAEKERIKTAKKLLREDRKRRHKIYVAQQDSIKEKQKIEKKALRKEKKNKKKELQASEQKNTTSSAK